MKKMSQICSLIFVLIFSSFAFAAGEIEVDSFRVTGLSAFKGKRLSVYYVSARPATLETPGQIAKVRKILKGPLTYSIDANGVAQVDSVSVPRDGWTTFNHLIFVVHAQTKHSLQNVDGSLPEVLDTDNEVPFKSEHAGFLYRKSMLFDRAQIARGEIKLF
ncbi:MAG: hypothetical protein CME71_09845 [Halobacteriovorax sp.]|nr:hypothetical protein [Halobacteriovorax sp.]|tara:strand:+ start:1205 stop:1687 length:483 start_codon:yes stop_codon:yes gene_type:complete